MVRVLSVVLALGLITPALKAEDKDKVRPKDRPIEKVDRKENPVDKDFLIEIVQCANNADNILSLADRFSQSDKVKEFSKKVRNDHQDLMKTHSQVFKDNKLTVAASLDRATSDKITELKKKDKADFDKAMLDAFIEHHEKAIKMVENEKKNGKDETIKKMSGEVLAAMEKHLKEAKDLRKDLK